MADWWADAGREGAYERCDFCDRPLWRDRCSSSRCRENSQRHLRRHGERITLNLARFPGDVVMLTVTGPGSDVLPPCERTGLDAISQWNATMTDRWRKLRRVACQSAHRKVRGQRNGVLVVVPELQRRGVLHVHVVLGAESVLERRWCEAFVRSVRKNARRHGFGRQIHVGKRWDSAASAAAGYLSKVASYVSKARGLQGLWEDGTLPGRSFYVARRLTSATGVTMRMLRRRGIAWARWRQLVPLAKICDWAEWERGLERELTRAELRSLVLKW